jgi:hypothetical protein
VAALAAGHGEPAGRPSLVTERVHLFDVDESGLAGHRHAEDALRKPFERTTSGISEMSMAGVCTDLRAFDAAADARPALPRLRLEGRQGTVVYEFRFQRHRDSDHL